MNAQNENGSSYFGGKSIKSARDESHDRIGAGVEINFP